MHASRVSLCKPAVLASLWARDLDELCYDIHGSICASPAVSLGRTRAARVVLGHWRGFSVLLRLTPSCYITASFLFLYMLSSCDPPSFPLTLPTFQASPLTSAQPRRLLRPISYGVAVTRFISPGYRIEKASCPSRPCVFNLIGTSAQLHSLDQRPHSLLLAPRQWTVFLPASQRLFPT